MKRELENYFDKLWPINRSLTGAGCRKTLSILSEIVDFNIIEIPSGTPVFDWVVPNEWNVKEAWIKDSKGKIIVDFKHNNLHLVGYSQPCHKKLSIGELRKHIFTLPEHPDWIPYRTTYYKKDWGFCMSKNQFDNLSLDEIYEVFIDCTHDSNGSMTIGEAVLYGESEKEILFSTYICHPSMANNELSGPLLTAFLYRELKKQTKRHYTYRFVFLPETIGAVSYLSRIGNHLKENVVSGFVITTVGDAGNYTLKLSKQGDALCDRAVKMVLNETIGEGKYRVDKFFPMGSDERQYSSPGFNIPVCVFARTRYGLYPEYHTSADNKTIISFEAMVDTISKYIEVVNLMDKNRVYVSRYPYCEPQLGKRDLYAKVGGSEDRTERELSILWLLNYADGEHDLISIAEKSKMPHKVLMNVAEELEEKQLIEIK